MKVELSKIFFFWCFFRFSNRSNVIEVDTPSRKFYMDVRILLKTVTLVSIYYHIDIGKLFCFGILEVLLLSIRKGFDDLICLHPAKLKVKGPKLNPGAINWKFGLRRETTNLNSLPVYLIVVGIRTRNKAVLVRTRILDTANRQNDTK